MNACSKYNTECNIINITESFDVHPVFNCQTHRRVHVCNNTHTCKKEYIDNTERCIISGTLYDIIGCYYECLDDIGDYDETTAAKAFTDKGVENHHPIYIKQLQEKLSQAGCLLPLDHIKKMYFIVCNIYAKLNKKNSNTRSNIIDAVVYVLSHKLKTIFIRNTHSIRKKKGKQFLKRTVEKQLPDALQNIFFPCKK